jgi:hypothetical protein
MPFYANQAQRRAIIELILDGAPHTLGTEKYHQMARDLDQLEWETLLTIRQSQRSFPVLKVPTAES